jgi:predicted DCC family thiol-disulfide oxidoreductase YuxK
MLHNRHGIDDFHMEHRAMKLTLFYDSQCPLCVAEMRRLKAFDSAGRMAFADLHAPDFIERYPHVDRLKACRILHGQLDSGELLLGLDVTHLAWSLAGRHKWLALLRWPLVKPAADAVYLLFARCRYGISWLLTGKSRCNSCSLDALKDNQYKVLCDEPRQ